MKHLYKLAFGIIFILILTGLLYAILLGVDYMISHPQTIKFIGAIILVVLAYGVGDSLYKEYV